MPEHLKTKDAERRSEGSKIKMPISDRLNERSWVFLLLLLSSFFPKLMKAKVWNWFRKANDKLRTAVWDQQGRKLRQLSWKEEKKKRITSVALRPQSGKKIPIFSRANVGSLFGSQLSSFLRSTLSLTPASDHTPLPPNLRPLPHPTSPLPHLSIPTDAIWTFHNCTNVPFLEFISLELPEEDTDLVFS